MVKQLKTTLAVLSVATVLTPVLGHAITANVNAEVLQGFTIAELDILNFGQFSANGTPGSIHIDYTNGTATPTDISLVSGTTKRGRFSIDGAAGVAYTLALPASPVTLTRSGGTETMSLTVQGPAGGNIPGGGGPDIFYVGGTLSVASGQAVGSYSGTYAVTAGF